LGWPTPRRHHLATVAGTATAAGIGFTVSLLITGLAFDTPELQNAARLAIRAASITTALAGTAVLLRSSPSR
jgi:Na+:H+ antiporter, NhaA family